MPLAAASKGTCQSTPLAEHQILRLPRKKQRRRRHAKAYIRPLAPCIAPTDAPATPKQRRPRMPGCTSDPFQRTKCCACHARDARAYTRPLAEHQVLRLPRKKQRRPRDARAYIRPLAEQCRPRKKQRRPRDAMSE